MFSDRVCVDRDNKHYILTSCITLEKITKITGNIYILDWDIWVYSWVHTSKLRVRVQRPEYVCEYLIFKFSESKRVQSHGYQYGFTKMYSYITRVLQLDYKYNILVSPFNYNNKFTNTKCKEVNSAKRHLTAHLPSHIIRTCQWIIVATVIRSIYYGSVNFYMIVKYGVLKTLNTWNHFILKVNKSTPNCVVSGKLVK